MDAFIWNGGEPEKADCTEIEFPLMATQLTWADPFTALPVTTATRMLAHGADEVSNACNRGPES